jgi:hypothetical protein
MMPFRRHIKSLSAEILVVSCALLAAEASFGQPIDTAVQQAAHSRSTYRPSRFSRRAELNYSVAWGVDALSVKLAESGELVRFSYRVLDPQRAATLNDKKAEPALIDPSAGVSLSIPSLEKVGQLRQSSSPEANRQYWMAFSNRGRHVKRGDRVNVMIGAFHATGLVVE